MKTVDFKNKTRAVNNDGYLMWARKPMAKYMESYILM